MSKHKHTDTPLDFIESLETADLPDLVDKLEKTKKWLDSLDCPFEPRIQIGCQPVSEPIVMGVDHAADQDDTIFYAIAFRKIEGENWQVWNGEEWVDVELGG